ncbi:MAG: hypothetical protein A2W52_04605 [Candidatus Taylorbacteria bacterium RIFCSPHIGHO2_02_49_25]|uniref:Uncharacterized protein n=1 Tax=Candidatus Taylorbacteria bacterium RIFCSPHIGHO2_02_49_25 TaxID=1802305 RepID=A0A1G2MBM4_9BACT|nr:MAG: hypothetical protein UY62_C0023G0017 [Parcubacteria group bacterium GW2011_GWF2_50_9]OHA21297.1 MAG: hypothetical protein A2W52_04605 [Candidatus Taylorbacteria bacterium RIFCSPHIGHO2_02_49_25]OHA21490.1 MAG: hypothetical protein A2759_02530 [Candidatus Taylorbacteria bacterium RIFCSPHIGHO2_01_FULL_49_60]OHA36009.1 MAG: hypothetical protein A3B27_03160 [Candidatus Taylorbacteria bacterium RIFCSPLOWO2_01_FULL_50_130]OHA36438.1 MAG: hypothetical protein A2W65_02595 [Candidatus Taylorbacte
MSETFKNREQQEGWKNETGMRAGALKDFLVEALHREFRNRYDDPTELYFSGSSPEMENVQRGSIPPASVRVLYQNGEITKVHAYYPSNRGQSLDVYVSGKALEDFLKKE